MHVRPFTRSLRRERHVATFFIIAVDTKVDALSVSIVVIFLAVALSILLWFSLRSRVAEERERRGKKMVLNFSGPLRVFLGE
jgi:hypothetical protein